MNGSREQAEPPLRPRNATICAFWLTRAHREQSRVGDPAGTEWAHSRGAAWGIVPIALLADDEGMLEQELQRIYDSEINVRIGWLWDGGSDVRLGDGMDGFLAEH